jgi:uncharacterized protein YndB with AHSA1/START domain
MELKFRVAGRIAKPVPEVFEAVVNPEQLSRYFTTGGAKGRLETGATVTWDFHDFPGAFPVKVIDVVKNEKIVFQWAAFEGPGSETPAYDTTVTMTFETGRHRPHTGDDIRGRLAPDARRAERLLWQLRGLDRRALRHESLAGARPQPARRILQVAHQRARQVNSSGTAAPATGFLEQPRRPRN